MRERRRPAASARSLAPFRKGALQHRTAGGGAAESDDARHYLNSHLAPSGSGVQHFRGDHQASGSGSDAQHFLGGRLSGGGGGGFARELKGDPGGVDAVPVNAVAMCPRAAVAVTASKQVRGRPLRHCRSDCVV
eukprot:TRINITY_DN7515_c0_g1_i2.p1 TRINITY_DN7515_c0_g1~~TRINITY_DN7515_c0_g1_i2.p1  ORF type:complete len:134 (+),score=32.90 TRINITY_DN7515_c0_g1_i2:378-779(+)